jgi:hypothetical protein
MSGSRTWNKATRKHLAYTAFVVAMAVWGGTPYFFCNYFRCSKSSDPSHNCFPIEYSTVTSDVEVNFEYTLHFHYWFIIHRKCVVRGYTVNDNPLLHSGYLMTLSNGSNEIFLTFPRSSYTEKNQPFLSYSRDPPCTYNVYLKCTVLLIFDTVNSKLNEITVNEIGDRLSLIMQ